MRVTLPSAPSALPGAVLVASALLAAPPTAPLEAQEASGTDPMPILEEAAALYRSLDAFCAHFRQVRRVPLLDQVTRSEGRLCQQKPDRFLMDFSDPPHDVVVADGEHLWIYYPSVDAEQVFRQDLASGGGGRFDFHREFLSDPGTKYRPRYEGADTVDGHPTHVLGLVPRSPSPYEEARVWIDRKLGLIRRVEIREENDSVREVELSALELEPSLPPETFRFDPPPGAQVIRR